MFVVSCIHECVFLCESCSFWILAWFNKWVFFLFQINLVPTKPIEGQKTGTSGLRKKVSSLIFSLFSFVYLNGLNIIKRKSKLNTFLPTLSLQWNKRALWQLNSLPAQCLVYRWKFFSKTIILQIGSRFEYLHFFMVLNSSLVL